MSLREISLKWNGFESNIVCSLRGALRREELADVCLVGREGGAPLRCHRVVLAACSPFFRDIFVQNPHPSTVVVLPDISLFNLKALLTFIYNGEVNVDQDDLSELLKAAEALKIRGLTTVTEDVVDPSFSQANNKGIDGTNEKDQMSTHQIQSITEESEKLTNTEDVPLSPSLSPRKCPLEPLAYEKHGPRAHSFRHTHKWVVEDTKPQEVIPKDEPPDLICVEAILSEGYGNETDDLLNNIDHSLFVQIDKNHANNVDILRKQSIKNGKIRKKKLKKKHSMMSCLVDNSERIKFSDTEIGKENMVTDEDTEKIIDNVLHSDILDTFSGDDSKIEHPKTNLEEASPKFPCPFCDRTYCSWGYRRRHVKSRHKSDQLTCKLCGVIMVSQSSWISHMVQEHKIAKAETRDSIVILVEAHAVLTCTSPPSPTCLLKDQDYQETIEC